MSKLSAKTNALLLQFFGRFSSQASVPVFQIYYWNENFHIEVKQLR